MNRYVYAAGNPVRFSDPSGHNFIERIKLGAITLGTSIGVGLHNLERWLQGTLEYVIHRIGEAIHGLWQLWEQISNVGGGAPPGAIGEGINSTLSPIMQQALDILRDHPTVRGFDFYSLLEDGTIELIEGVPGMVSNGTLNGNQILVNPSVNNPYDTAATIVEEIFHTFQPAGTNVSLEIEAWSTVRFWAENSLEENGSIFSQFSRLLTMDLNNIESRVLDRYGLQPGEYVAGILSHLYDSLNPLP